MTTRHPLLNYIAVVLAFLLIVAAGWIVWDYLDDAKEVRNLEKEKKRVLLLIDSVEAYRRQIAEQRALWIIIDKERRDSFKIALNVANSYQKKYEKLRKAPIVRYNEPQLDSVIGGIIGRYYPAVQH